MNIICMLTNHFKDLEIYLCFCFVGHEFPPKKHHLNQLYKSTSSTSRASLKSAQGFSFYQEIWLTPQFGYIQLPRRDDECTIQIL